MTKSPLIVLTSRVFPETRAALAATFAEPNRRLEELLGWSGVWHP